MKIKSIIISLSLLVPALSVAAGEVVSVPQVTSAVTLEQDVDYHITGVEPFASGGSVDIVNTDHALLILDNVRPSVAKGLLKNIKVNGVTASAANSQVRIYAHGSAIYPYPETCKPLSVYDGKNYEGESFSDYEVGSAIRLSAATMNNRIMSFKLKRGYMVCMATLVGGGGYNRVFVADSKDVEIPLLQAELRGRVSFIRISKWNSTDKRGYAGNDVFANTQLNTTWCYNWDAGINVWDDREYVTHHHHEGWPGIADVGNNGTSANILGNNEPDNTGDDREQVNSVDEVLANWPAMMATGKRLGSPAVSGNYTWLYDFIDSIDARGWRCDFIAVHAYWYSDKGSWEWQMNNIHSRTKRPIWITEMNYGANWTGWPAGDDRSGSPANYAIEKQHFAPTLDYLESAPFVERYAVYNWVQDCRKMVNTGDETLADKNYLTPTGEYYAAIDTDLGYNETYEYVPTPPRMTAPYALSCSYTPRTSVCQLSWRDANCEFNDSIFVERRLGAKGEWERIGTVATTEAITSYAFKDTVTSSGHYFYRIHEVTFDGADFYSPEAVNVINGTEGTPDVQYGTVSASSLDESYNYFSTPFTDMPAIVFGCPTSCNTDVKPVEHVISSYKLNDKYAYFRFKYYPWTLSGYQSFTNGPEFSSYIVAKGGNGKLGELNYEAGYIHDAAGKELSVSNDTVDFKFDTPFAEAPVVMVTPRYSSSSYPYMWRVWNVTNEGFKVVLLRQKGLDAQYPGFAAQRVAYFAIDKGSSVTPEGKKFVVGDTLVTFTNQGSLYKINFGQNLSNPLFLGQLQTFNRKVAALLRTGSTGPAVKYCNVRLVPDSSDIDNRTMSRTNPIIERVGWITVSDGEGSAVHDVSGGTAADDLVTDVVGDRLYVTAPSAASVSVYTLNGVKVVSGKVTDGNAVVDISPLAGGLYVVRTNSGSSSKFVK